MTTGRSPGTTPSVEFVDSLPSERGKKWTEIRATLAGRVGEWARIDAKGGYPRARLRELGCETKIIDGDLYARWMS